MVVLRPGLRDLDGGHFAMIVSAMAFAGSYLLASRLSKQVPAMMVVFLMSVKVPLLLLPFALLDWVWPDVREIALLFGTAGFATAAHYCMTRAFACAPQSVLQPVVFTQLVWSVLIGWLYFGEAVDIYVLLGGGLIVSAVTFIMWREARAKAVAADVGPMSAQTSDK